MFKVCTRPVIVPHRSSVLSPPYPLSPDSALHPSHTQRVHIPNVMRALSSPLPLLLHLTRIIPAEWVLTLLAEDSAVQRWVIHISSSAFPPYPRNSHKSLSPRCNTIARRQLAYPSSRLCLCLTRRRGSVNPKLEHTPSGLP